ncbi:ABCG transporter ABC superfamily [Phytophthora sojae]|uniref:ABCG transporter ABC superfamily n=1 Tax=Phytophthora sojae (strain P6497) TaxID=1094619 RepID=G4ZPV4_PHYSP|nr:ABCG transporter ABC superfamily [Phytophthora sojae]EGZ16359.1 ABCG transporter ABC superfamily [Phytophthora sojae]|eukprot:XP_009530108.1 ABCG transporter ABC superfamily [Phytophthora sojae]
MASPAAPYAVMPEMSPPILERSMLESGYTRESGRTVPNGTSDYSSDSLHRRCIAAKYEEFMNPCVLSWTDLSYAVPGKKTAKNPYGKKTILHKVSGRSAPGELTAIMGPSGSGKTTLVDLLADRLSTGQMTGTIELNGSERVTKTFRAVTSYVAQEDTLLGSFTVVETMNMAARLSLPNSVVMTDIHSRVESVMDAMGLGACRNTLVGDIFRKGLSGGQKRRLSIAIELLSNPSILILDEPTSGLDSSSAHNVMKYILKLCGEGKNVVCTIHQPSSLVYDMFTNVVLLSGGETVYYGSRTYMIPHFSGVGFNCPKYMNPAEYFVNLVNTDFEDHVDITKLVHAYKQSTVKKLLLDQLAADRTTLQHLPDIELQPSSAMRQFSVLMYRNLVNNIRNPGIYWIRLFMYFCLSFMVGTMYLSSNDDLTEEDLIPMLFYVQAFLVFMSVAVLPFFIEQRAVFARERANSSLSVVSYVCANFLATLPGIFLIVVMSTALVVLLAGLNAFEYFLLNLFLSLVVAESMMHVIGAAVPHYIIGIALGAGVFGMFMLCEGFMVPRDSIPDYWIWGYYLAFHSYSFESFVFKQFENETSDEARAILKKYGMEDVDVPKDMLYLVGYIAVFQLIFMFILWKFHTGRR